MSSLVARFAVGVSGVMRRVGGALDGLGKSMEVTQYTENLVPSTRFVAVDGVGPNVSEMSFVAPSASVIGNVTIGKESSVWYGAVVRGDVNHVTVGSLTSIGDRAVVHVAKIQGDFPTHIGSYVTVGAGALIHAATLKDHCVIGEAAQVLDGAVVESNAMIAPASVVTPGTQVGAGELWAGAPAKMVRLLTEAEVAGIPKRALEIATLASEHSKENAKDYKQILEEEELADIEEHIDDVMFRGKRDDEDLSDVLGQGHPGRVFRSTLSHPEEALKQQQAAKNK